MVQRHIRRGVRRHSRRISQCAPDSTHLFIPGPTNIPEDVRQAMNVPMQDMRAPDFGDLTLSLFSDIKAG
jgi:aspartate aminotransferase-like enzyme